MGGLSAPRLTTALVRSDVTLFVTVAAVVTVAAAAQAYSVVLLFPIVDALGIGGPSDGGVARAATLPLDLLGLRPSLAASLAVYAVTAAAATALSAWGAVLRTTLQLDFVNDTRSRLHRALVSSEWRHLVELRRSDATTALTVDTNIVATGAAAVLSLGSSLAVVGLQIAVATRISWTTTALAAAVGLLLVGATWPLTRRGRTLGQELNASNRGINRAVEELLDGLKLAKANAAEQPHRASFDAAIARSRRSQLDFVRVSVVVSAARSVVTLCVVAVVVVAALSSFDVPTASLVVLAFVFSRIVPAVSSMQRLLLQVSQAGPAYEQIVTLTRECELAGEPQGARADERLAIGAGVRLVDVHFSYRPDRPVLRGVDLDVPPRSFVALVGPSGAGKTTVADLLCGLLTPASGSIEVDGREIGRDDVRRWRHSIAVVPQEPVLFDTSVRDNVTWGTDADDAAVVDALGRAAALEFVERLPDGLATEVGSRGAKLSGGERQRLALARALLREPELLLLDEATSALDPENERLIGATIGALRSSTTIVVIAHRLSTVRAADTVVVLDDGRVSENGSWDDLASREDGRLRSLIRAGELA